MDWSLTINVTVTGIVLVFAMLLLLVFILYIFGWVSTSVQKAAKKRLDKALSSLSEETTEPAEDNTSVETGNSDEIVAVITAAVASLYTGTAKKTVIKSFKKSGGRRSIWANAGVRDNTRAF